MGLKMTRRIEAGWLTAPQTVRLMAALDAARTNGSRYVGGCVRASVMGLGADDVDIATQLHPDQVLAALKAADIHAIPTGIEHGTITAIVDHTPFEITTLRRDVETDGRRAVVAFTEDWHEDAARRDFRLNALYAEADGTVHEGVSGGLEDARAGRVIFIGDADMRLREDYLRILRFFRFNAWYGNAIDAGGLAACARQASGLSKIAAERKWKELKRLLAAPDPGAAMLAMEASGVLAEIVPGASAGLLPGLIQTERALALAPDPLRRLMAMIPRRVNDVDALAADLRLSNAERGRLAGWANADLPSLAGAGEADLRAAIYRHGKQAACDRIIIEKAMGEDGDIQVAMELAEAWDAPQFPLRGDDALALGLDGPAVGRALQNVEERWIAAGFAPEREDLLAWLAAAANA